MEIIMRYFTLIFLFLLTISAIAGEGKVKYIIGDVDYKQNYKQSDWFDLQLKNNMPEGSIVRTGSRSKCEISMADGSYMILSEYSMMQLKNLPDGQKQKANLFALIGKIFFSVKKSIAGNFRVKSPASVAVIRGTEFLLSNTKTKSEIWVKTGSVVFSDVNETQKVIVSEGQKAIVETGKMPTKPVSLSPREDREMASYLANNSTGSGSTGLFAAAGVASSPVSSPLNSGTENPGGTSLSSSQDLDDPPPPRTGDSPAGMGLSIGAVTVDNQIFTQISFMPEFSIGKFGLGLDLRLFIDGNGDIVDENWDTWSDIVEKIYYVRWAQKGDPFYARVGAINNYRLGYGILMNKYRNTIQYPENIRVGMTMGVDINNVKFDFLLNDFKELGKKKGGVFGARLGYSFLGALEIGASIVYDRNQYATLRDNDGDGVANALDDFPNDAAYRVDTDGDGVPDHVDPDRNANGYTDNSQDIRIFNNDIFWNDSLLKPAPLTITDSPNKEQIAYAADIGFTFVNKKHLQLIAYGQAAKFGYGGGWGYTVPGIQGKMAFINFYGEYRIQEPKFLPEYFSTTYDIERVIFEQDSLGFLYPVTRRSYLDSINSRMQGFVIGADFNLWDVMIFGADYQNLHGTAGRINTFRADLFLNTSFIPKIQRAGVYYYQQNAQELFTKTEGTIYGGVLQYEIAPGAALMLDYRVTYKDLNGDGVISGSQDMQKTTNIQTVFTF